MGYTTEKLKEKAILVSASFDSIEKQQISLDELERLAETAGVIVKGRLIQKIREITPATFMGQGKLEELKELVENEEADLIIFDDELSGSQMRNIAEFVGVRIIDRSTLILDIFAIRATTNEGKVQVLLAQQKYNISRLAAFSIDSGRFGGGVGMRGPGETKIEMNKRAIKESIFKLEKEIENINANRKMKRKSREESSIKKIAIVGYTNAGKSTLFNTLTKASIYADDKLFATLDTTTRTLFFDYEKKCVITDTVGFINKLPHTFIEAFSSTLEESVMADLILHVVDVSNKDYQTQIDVVNGVLGSLGVKEIPVMIIYNKIDKLNKPYEVKQNEIFISAYKNIGIDALREKIVEQLWG